MELFRIIYADSLNEVDFNNFGNHFSSNEDAICKYFADTLAKSSFSINGCDNSDKEEKFIFIVEVDEKDINQEATEESNLYYPDEFEVVLKENSTIKINEVWSLVTQEEVEKDVTQANTGTRIDEWVK